MSSTLCLISKSDFYVSDHLTGHFNHLLYCARSIAREKNYNFVWVSDSKIFVKKSRDCPVILIKNLDDLKKLGQNQ